MLDLKAEFELARADARTAIDRVLDHQCFIGGPEVAQLEAQLADLCGVPHAVAISSGTDALLCLLMALEVGPGDEVICPPFTFFATAGCIARTGAKPVFVDIDPATFNIGPAEVASAVTARTKAIIAVHLFGQCADMDAIAAAAPGVALIEDAAQAIGATYKDRPAGSLGLGASFSFYPTKNLGGFGEGGAIVTGDSDLAQRCRVLRNHGETSRYHHAFIGGNFRLDSLKSGLLLAKLKLLDRFQRARAQNAARYDELLKDVPVQTPVIAEHNGCVYHQYSVLCDRRDELMAYLKGHGVGSGIYYPVPLHLQECFAHLGYKPGDLPVSESICRRILSLPVHPMLADDDLQHVATTMKCFWESGESLASSRPAVPAADMSRASRHP
ncbi:MAG: DegT/DnrJ/EryC1/StrS family aminotransferase [Phycisphaerae bacterium]